MTDDLQNLISGASGADDGAGGISVSSGETEEKFEERMKAIGIKEKEKLTEEKAQSLGLGYINLEGFPIAPEALSLLDEPQAKKLQAITFFYNEEEMRLGVANPDDPKIAELIEEFKGKLEDTNIDVYLISENSLELGLKLYAAIPKVKKVASGVAITEAELNKYKRELKNLKDLDKKIQKADLTEMVTMILAGAINAGTSDVHVECEEKEVKVRYRIDGVLQDVAHLNKDIWSRLISRIKVISKLKINVTNIPQDGRITIYLTNDKIDVRVSTLPTAYGESVVMRLLLSGATGLEFDDLGIRGKAYDDLKRETERPNGMIVTTGPTGSGKTTTLYAILNKLNQPEVKIITLEDPIEYKLTGINQSQVSSKKGSGAGGGGGDLKTLLTQGLSGGGTQEYTFSQGLRAILRQDPDIVMVGEIRDLETAEIAIQAALTGHLMISTIHTNSASGAIPRFLSMGVKPFLLAPALNAVIGQRLLRRICKECKEETTIDDDKLKRVKEILSQIPENSGYKADLDKLKFHKGKGCDTCNGLGYKGRIGIYEIFTMNKEIEQVILSGKVSEYTMQEIAVKNGMISMVQDGLLKAIDGLTSIEEVFRVIE